MEKQVDSRTRIILEPRRLRFKLLQLKREALLTDISLRCHGKTIPVHKCILSASSIFFKLLFTDAKLEPLQTFDLSTYVKVEDFECLESIINYMYSGEVHLSEENFVVMASLSGFFSMSDLTGLCTSFLKKILSGANCLPLYFGMQQFEQHLRTTVPPVIVHRGTEIQDKLLEMLNLSFYKDILLQDHTFQLSASDMQQLLGMGFTKNFSAGNVLEFVSRWLKLHSDRDSIMIADILINHVQERIDTAEVQEEMSKMLDKIKGFVNDIEGIMDGLALQVSEEYKTNFLLRMANITHELHKIREQSLQKVKVELSDGQDLENKNADVDDTEKGDDAIEDAGSEPVISDSDTIENDAGSIKDAMETEEIKVEKDNTTEVEQYDSDVMERRNRRKNRRKIRRVVPMIQEDDDDEEDRAEFGEAPVNSQLNDELTKDVIDLMGKSVKRNAAGKYDCILCTKEFKRKHSLLLHLNTHTGSKPYRCVECGMLFYRSYHVIRHMRRKHADKTKFECDVCDKVFTDPKEVVAHTNVHYRELNEGVKKVSKVEDGDYIEVKTGENGEDQYWCKQCEKQFSRLSHLKEHVMIHTGIKPFGCDICDSSFKSKYELNKHITSCHPGVSAKFKCENCKRPFHTQKAFEKHGKSCVGRNFHCDVCGASFHRQYHLDRHLSVHSDDKPYACPHCDKKFKYDNKLKAHIKSHDEADAAKRSVICELCGTILKDVKYLKRHLSSHSGVKPHKCPVCLKTYTQAAGLQVHMRIHTGAKPFQCEICSMLFSVKSNLMRHQRRHRGDRRHKCDQCGKGFVMMSDLKRHYTMHTGEKNFACRYCGKKFSSNSKLPQHERIHTGEKPYECRVCGKRFIQSGDRTRHEAIHGVKAPPKPKNVSLYDMTNNTEPENPQTTVSNETATSATSGGSLTSPSRRATANPNRFTNHGSNELLRGAAPNFTHRGEISSDVMSRETVNNNIVNIGALNREPLRGPILGPDLLNSQSKQNTGLNLVANESGNRQVQPVISCGQPNMSYMTGNPGIPSHVQNEALMRDMYAVTSVYTQPSSTASTFFTSLGESNYIHY